MLKSMTTGGIEAVTKNEIAEQLEDLEQAEKELEAV